MDMAAEKIGYILDARLSCLFLVDAGNEFKYYFIQNLEQPLKI